MKLDEILEKVDLDKVSQAISQVEEGQSPLREYDLEDARRMVRAGIEKWLLKDYQGFQSVEVEQEKWLDVGGMGQVHGFIDLILKQEETVTILDWKTSRSTLDEEWCRRLKDSWQWRYYSQMTGASQVIYRGISRPTMSGQKWVCTTRELRWPVPETNKAEVFHQLEHQLAMRQTLVEMGAETWPQSKPGACMAFGQLCPFVEDCRNGTMPKQRVLEKEMSYSSLERFALCPERSRRMLLIPQGEDSEEQGIGKAVHRGFSSVYEQVWGGKE